MSPHENQPMCESALRWTRWALYFEQQCPVLAEDAESWLRSISHLCSCRAMTTLVDWGWCFEWTVRWLVELVCVGYSALYGRSICCQRYGSDQPSHQRDSDRCNAREHSQTQSLQWRANENEVRHCFDQYFVTHVEVTDVVHVSEGAGFNWTNRHVTKIHILNVGESTKRHFRYSTDCDIANPNMVQVF